MSDEQRRKGEEFSELHSAEEKLILNIACVNYIGIRILDRSRSVPSYETLGFALVHDVGFDEGHPIIMKHASGVVLNLLGPATSSDGKNILMDVDEKYPGYTHIALTVSSLDDAKELLTAGSIPVTGSLSFGSMSAIFIRDADRNVIELDAYADVDARGADGYSDRP